MSQKRVEYFSKTCWQEQFNLTMHLENVLKIHLFKMSRRCLEEIFARHLEQVLKTPWRRLDKASWRCLEDIFKTSWKRLEDVLKTSWKCQQTHNVYATLVLGHIYVMSNMNVYTTLLQRLEMNVVLHTFYSRS